jgi:hypothetical protein
MVFVVRMVMVFLIILNELQNISNMQRIKAHAEAQLKYGLFLQTGKGVSVDLERAAHDWKLAADQGHVLAQYNYGCCLQTGRGVSINLAEAATYLKSSADQGRCKWHNIIMGIVCKQVKVLQLI